MLTCPCPAITPSQLGIDTTNPALATGIGVYIAGLTL